MFNPWMSAWANPPGARSDPFEPWTRAAREFWAAELQRQQGAMTQEAYRQAWQFWINFWTVLPFSLMGLNRTTRPY